MQSTNPQGARTKNKIKKKRGGGSLSSVPVILGWHIPRRAAGGWGLSWVFLQGKSVFEMFLLLLQRRQFSESSSCSCHRQDKYLSNLEISLNLK